MTISNQNTMPRFFLGASVGMFGEDCDCMPEGSEPELVD
jgi:hypothetical protein